MKDFRYTLEHNEEPFGYAIDRFADVKPEQVVRAAMKLDYVKDVFKPYVERSMIRWPGYLKETVEQCPEMLAMVYEQGIVSALAALSGASQDGCWTPFYIHAANVHDEKLRELIGPTLHQSSRCYKTILRFSHVHVI